MDKVVGFLRNNLITVVEVIVLIYDAIAVAVNGLARLVPGNKTITAVHDFLNKVKSPLDSVKSFLLKIGG